MERQGVTTVQLRLDVPERLAKEARDAGLLTARALSRLLADAVRRAAADRLLRGARRASRAGGRRMSLRAIQAEVDAVRRGKRHSRES